MTTLLNRADIVSGLIELAEMLATQDLAVEIVVVGGAAMALEYDVERPATKDVDAWMHASTRVRECVAAAILDIARRRGWPDDWLNDKAAIFFPEDAASKDWHLHLVIGEVQVYVAEPEMLFAMKLRASRPTRDFEDLNVLADLLELQNQAAAIRIFESRFEDLALPARANAWLRVRFPEP